MIVYVVTARFSTTIQRLIHGLGADANGLLSYITYEELFFERAAPLAHTIFTDFDRLSRYELDCAAAVAMRLQAQAPEIRILNHPLHALERVALKTGMADPRALSCDPMQSLTWRSRTCNGPADR
jgi:hypothetical protein